MAFPKRNYGFHFYRVSHLEKKLDQVEEVLETKKASRGAGAGDSDGDSSDDDMEVLGDLNDWRKKC